MSGNRLFSRHGVALILMCWSLLAIRVVESRAAEGEPRFDIKGFIVQGNTLLPDKPLAAEFDDSPRFDTLSVQEILEEFLGPDKGVDVIEAARTKLEQSYHEQGYPTVLVNIPEQTVADGFVKLEVVESVIRRVRVTGNRYFTMENILKDVPTLEEGEIIYLPHLQEELALVNRNPDMRVEPVLVPGKTFGTVDVELKVTDKLPLHGSLELNNRASADTSPLRLNGVLRYDNLWQKAHSVSLQYQTAPKKTDEVQVVAGSYVMPTPWNDDHRLALFSVWSESQSAFGEGFQMIGSGYTFGVRYVMPLAPYKLYTHNISLGFDYKDFDETTTFFDENLKTPITYLPLTFSYNSSLPDEGGLTSFSSSLNMSMRGLVSDQREFETKRYMARADYLYLTAGVERMQKLPAKCSLFAKLDGQVSDQPLISNEQFTAGGMDTVRGYKESSAAGDEGVHATVELSGPDMAEFFEFAAKADLFPYLFYDWAGMRIRKPLEGQERRINLESAGFGMRGKITQYLDYEANWAIAMKDRSPTEAWHEYFSFKLKMIF